jgi:hypothetical protein
MLRISALALSLLASVSMGEILAQDSTDEVPATVSVVAVSEATAPAATAAGLSGHIKLKGEAPVAEPVDMSGDSVCHGMHEGGMTMSTVSVGEANGLADVFVQLTSGVPDERYKAPKEAVVLDQAGCTYVPHVIGMMKKQDIKILNSDETLHNIHPDPKINREFNVGMPEKGMEITKTFKKAEEALVVKCDVHTWMRAYVFVMEHPYFGVTDADGNFRIDTSELPDGEYGVKLWHETLGEKEGKLTLAGGKATYDFTYES